MSVHRTWFEKECSARRTGRARLRPDRLVCNRPMAGPILVLGGRAGQHGWARTQRNERCPSRHLIGPAEPAYPEGGGRQGKSGSDASSTIEFGG